MVSTYRRAGNLQIDAGRTWGRALAALVIGLVVPPALGQDAQRGRLLYETHCLSCHYERIHSRDPSRSTIKSRTALQIEVARWAAQVKRPFSTQEIDDIAEYLNQSHYRLGG
jgi:mono/diheme cytochrome c family protein